MEIEDLAARKRQKLYSDHRAMTQAALVQVFHKSESEAAQIVRDLWSRYDSVPVQGKDLLLHKDPVALACDLAGQEWSEVSDDLLRRFNDMRRASLEHSGTTY